MMERTSRFLSLSGWSGITAGIYALAGAFVAYKFFGFNPAEVSDENANTISSSSSLMRVVFLALAVLILTLATAIFLSRKKAIKRGEKLWNPTARRLLINMAVPLFAGGILILILIGKGLVGLVAPFTLLFYGLALFNASKFTYEDMKSLGLIEIVLGLLSCWFIEYGLLLWAVGFGVVHIIYGVYLHYRYER